MKKRISFILVCVLLVSLLAMNGHALEKRIADETCTEEETAYLSGGFCLSGAEGREILSEFAPEISYAEETYDLAIPELNAETFHALKQAAILNLENADYDFSGLIDAVAIACAGRRWQNEASAGLDRAITGTTAITVCRSFGPMRGVHVVDLPVGAAEAVSGTMPVGVSAGDEVSGVTLARSLFTRFSYTVSGPADGTKLSSGNTATHQTALGVLYGTIIKSVYESGRTGERIVTYYVEASSAIAQDYTILAAIGVPTYVNKADAGGVVRFSDPLALRDTIKEEPWELL